MWNVSGHEPLLRTLMSVLMPTGEVWMAYCHHWPGHGSVDQQFFNRASELGFAFEEVLDVSRATMASLFEGESQAVFVYRLWFASPSLHQKD